MKGLIIGAGVTGCYTAVLLGDKGLDVALLARGEKAASLDREGLPMRDGLSGDERSARPRIVRTPVAEEFAFVMVCVQEIQRPGVLALLATLPGRPIVWFLGNTTKGFEALGERLGRDRVLGGFPGVGGMWDGEVLVYADRERPGDSPFDKLVIGEGAPEAADAARTLRDHLVSAGMKVEHHEQIMAWHWSHLALVLPLGGAIRCAGGDVLRAAADRTLMKRTMRATTQGFAAVRAAGYPLLPRGLHLLPWIPTGIGARKIASLLRSRFGQVALAGHARAAHDELQSLAADLLALAGPRVGPDLRALMEPITDA